MKKTTNASDAKTPTATQKISATRSGHTPHTYKGKRGIKIGGISLCAEI